jgi:hypothetical protein
MFSELCCITTPLLSSSLSARQRKPEVPLREEGYRWLSCHWRFVWRWCGAHGGEVRYSHQKAIDVVSAEEGRRFFGVPSLFTKQLRAASKFFFCALYVQAPSCRLIQVDMLGG